MRTPKPKGPIQHIVIIVKENHTFDNYFGRFPGADGDPNLALASDPHTQHSHLSLVKFCEKTFGLPAINARDRAADDMSDCFDFRQKPIAAPAPAV